MLLRLLRYLASRLLVTLPQASSCLRPHHIDCIAYFQFGLFTTIHKHYAVEQWTEFCKSNPSVVKVSIYGLYILSVSKKFSLSVQPINCLGSTYIQFVLTYMYLSNLVKLP